MRKEHKPFHIKRIQHWCNQQYIQRIIRPQFQRLGTSPEIVQPYTLKLFGSTLKAGDFLHIISDKLKPVNLCCWHSKQQLGHITIGDYCLISPGATISSAENITLEESCMIGAEVSISDSDWHGVYNRIRPFRCTSPVILKRNVWVGHRSIIGKGVSIGENSIIAAGSVVVHDIPDNCIAGGNPAKVIKHINPKRRMLTREFLFKHDTHYWQGQRDADGYFLQGNTLARWLRTKVAPTIND